MDRNISANITSLRGIGAIAIVLYHYFSHINTYLYKLAFDYTKLTFAVPMFFLLSSMFLYKKAADFQNPIKLVLHRACRLYPAYWCGVIISYFSITVIANEKVSLLRLAANFLMVEDILGIKHLDGVYWTLLYELMLLFILAMASIISVKGERVVCKADNLCTVWLLIGVCLQILIKLSGKKLGGEDVVLLGGRFVPIFVFGIIFSQKFILKAEYNRKHQILNVLISIAYLWVCEPLDYFLMEIISISVVFAVLKGWLRKSKMLQNPILLFLGNISYCIYLVHNELGKAVISHLGGTERSMQFLAILSLVLVVILLSKWINLFSVFAQKQMEDAFSKLPFIKLLGDF